MKNVRIQSHADLRKQMKGVALGQKAAPKDAGGVSFESVEALMRLLTPENRALLAVIRDRKPQSIAELAGFVGRAPPNVTRTLSKLEAIGFVRMKSVKRRKVPVTSIRPFRISVDPFSVNDRLEMA